MNIRKHSVNNNGMLFFFILVVMEMNDEYFMKQALKEAQKAFDEDEVPIGAVIVQNNRIIAKGYNQVEKLNDSTAHAEIIALTAAFNFLGSKYLPDATLYVTIEPCVMCSGALYWSKIGKVIYGANDEKNGSITPLAGTLPHKDNWPYHPKTLVAGGVLQEDCATLIKTFFKKKR
jgi:tRNA(adenine34) deaminase